MRYLYIHDNEGGHPFKIGLDTSAHHLAVYPQIAPFTDKQYDARPVLQTSYKTIFIGTSLKTKITTASGNFGYKFAGNTVLIHLSGLKYIAINTNIFEFTSRAPIIKYTSPIGDNNIPYPYATDSLGNIYLLNYNTHVCIAPYDISAKIIAKCENPYEYYAGATTLIHKLPTVPPFVNYHDITGFYIGTQKHAFIIPINPSSEYDRLVKLDNKLLALEYANTHNKKLLTKQDYCALVNEYNEMMGFYELINYKEICKHRTQNISTDNK